MDVAILKNQAKCHIETKTETKPSVGRIIDKGD